MENQEIHWLLHDKYSGQECEAFLADCVRLQAGEPLGHVIGYVPFLDCQIWLDSHPLIPRPETEYWTEQAVAAIRDRQATQTTPVQVLDLCAGSGAIGVAVAQAVPGAAVTFAELDPHHLPTIEKNIKENASIYSSVSKLVHDQKYRVLESNLFSEVSGVFDFILTNPPYIDAAAGTADESVTAHEPHLALFGGIDGLAVITQIITEASTYLAPQTGQLWIEHEPFQHDNIAVLAARAGFDCKHYCDQYHTVRYSILSWPVAL